MKLPKELQKKSKIKPKVNEYFLKVGNNRGNHKQEMPTWEDIIQKYIDITGKSPYQENDKNYTNDFVNWLFTISIIRVREYENHPKIEDTIEFN